MKNSRKEYSKKELYWLGIISDLKWPEDFICKKCSHSGYSSGKTPFARKCTRAPCKHEESATANTVFHGLKFSIEKAIKILEYLYDIHEEYYYRLANNPYLQEKLLEKPFLRMRYATVRASPAYIASGLKMHERTVYLFLQRFMNALPEFEPTRNITAQWFRGVKLEERDVYANLFYAIDSTEDLHSLLRICLRGFSSDEDG